MLLPTLLITLLALLVDILLFIPHLAWGGYIVIAATVLILISGIMTCGMRRTLVSRKARQKRIAENAEMNGDNYYGRQEALKADSPPPLNPQLTAPMVDGPVGADSLPSFASFDTKQAGRMSEDDRTPLNRRTPSNPSTSNGVRPGDDGMDRYGAPVRGGMGGMGGMRGRGGRMYNGPRDEFGNPLPPSPAFGPGPGGRRSSDEQGMRHQYSNETMNSQTSRWRGRGGYAPRGYGRGGPYGGRGGPFGGRGGPGMNGNGRGGIPLGQMAAGAGAGMMAGEMMDQDRRGPPPGYANGYPPPGRGGMGPNSRNQSPAGYGPPGGYARRQSPGRPPPPGYGPPGQGAFGYGRDRSASNGPQYRRESPPQALALHPNEAPGIGQAVEMDATTGSPSQSTGFPGHPLRESDSDVQGLVGLQQNRIGSPLRDSPRSPTSQYSAPGEYVTPRAAWAGGPGRNGTPPLAQGNNRSPIELAARHSPPQVQSQTQTHSPTHARMNSADNYYEDVDPRFAEPATDNPTAIPALLMPSHTDDHSPTQGNSMQYQPQEQQPHHLGVTQGQGPRQYLEPTSSYESFEDSRSPAESDITSISRRGVNPDWRPGPEQGAPGYGGPPGPGAYGGNNGANGAYVIGGGPLPNRRPMGQPQRGDVLAGNPDFELGPRQGTGVARRGLM
ncbi:hypothetical protein MMC32_007115 [Xylographa parallela]|nr:hypothetical protein [Xylographa parallela]